jgi:hypothetical protein
MTPEQKARVSIDALLIAANLYGLLEEACLDIQ